MGKKKKCLPSTVLKLEEIERGKPDGVSKKSISNVKVLILREGEITLL